MTAHPALTPSADTSRAMPEGSAARLDACDHALQSLARERHRLERLGFELPLARCDRQLRYWRFVQGVLSIAASGEPRLGRQA